MIRYSKLWIVFLVIILMNGCERKAEKPTSIQTDILETEKISTFEEAPSGRISVAPVQHISSPADSVNEELMPLHLRFVIKEIPVGSLEPLRADFLSEYFQNDDYVLWEPPLDTHYRKIYFAVHYIKKFDYDGFYRTIFDKAVGFEITDDGIIPYLYIKDFQFLDKDGTVFIDFSEGYNGIFGFFLYYGLGSSEDVSIGINTYFDNGIREADSFHIHWNEDDKVFEERPYTLYWNEDG